jgi:hypothetical protein
MFAMNGQGLGHLIRSSVVGAALASVGERPVIFSGGVYRPTGLDRFPVRFVPSLWGATEEVRKRVASEVHSMASISLPSVVVEDTHPAPIQLPPEIRRVLLVRPTSFEYLLRLNEKYSELYAAFLLCDSPDSPTWPYDEAQTRQLAGGNPSAGGNPLAGGNPVAGWKKWHGIGPVYRTASEDDVRQVRARHHLSGDEEVCVFSMGGGGLSVTDPKGQDIIRFLRLASQVADVVERAGSRVRLLFVRGPYFPRRIPIPSRFELVQEEDQMPALLKIAKGAVIRAGFNTTWECIAAGTPFLPLVGTTYAEPVQERVSRLTSLGLIAPDIQSFWCDEQWRAEYRRVAGNVATAHPGAPEPLELRRLIFDREKMHSSAKPRPPSTRPKGTKCGIPLVIRIDDVVCNEPAFGWLLGVLAARGLRASLEVVPYLVEFDEGLLDHFDPSGALFEVSQHGYAHLPRTSGSGLRCEFSPENAAPTAEDLQAITRGKRHMEQAFPHRFTRGFSPPFDVLPPWLPAEWNALGGSFVSCLHTNTVPGSPLPVTRAGVDIWDWAMDRSLESDLVKHKLAIQLALDGHAGLVLHPRCLRNRRDKLRLLNLLNYAEASAATVSLRDVALGKIEAASPASRIGRLRASLAGRPPQRSPGDYGLPGDHER